MAFAIGIRNVRARLNQDKLPEDNKLEEPLGAVNLSASQLVCKKGSTKDIDNLEGFNTATREEEQVASSLRAMGCPGQVADLKREGSISRGQCRAVDVMQMKGTDRNPSVMPPDQVDLPMPCPESYHGQVGLFTHIHTYGFSCSAFLKKQSSTNKGLKIYR
ncbi:unnamed protein product [Fusarium venenatum]|uniref:Uncharacterized protein n=1 Tax=Fusarium venenatum TaxID=56646 RepID=A0A2L2TG12_9HYPO|nr:uncharacterized protein FVRRES_09989 [Fusarium venenatum]CEI69912.1 unnamed protein product [Fusarium venenatum]